MIKHLKVLTLLCIALLGITTTARADFSMTNTNRETLQIYQHPGETNLSQLVNKYFGLTGSAAYATSNDLYQDLGVKTSVTWNFNEGAKIIAHSKSSRYALEGWCINGDNRIFLNREFGRYDTELGGYSMTLPSGVNLSWELDVYNESNQKAYSLYYDPFRNPDQQVALIVFDVTGLMRQKYGDMNIESAYLLGWEDGFTTSLLDYDYQDSVYLVVNPAGTSTDVPEPATALIWGLGFLGTAGARSFRKRRNKVKALAS